MPAAHRPEVTPLRAGCLIWDIAGEYRSSLVIPSTLLLQVMYPMVGAAVWDHSVFRSDPWGVHRTSNSMLRYIYGGELALDEGRRLRELHRPFHGVDGQGRAYHALNGEAYAWVNGTLFERNAAVRRRPGALRRRAEQRVR